MIRKLLFPTDFSACAERAFSHAAHLADRYGAELHVLHVTEARRPAADDVTLTADEVAAELHLPAERRTYAKAWAHRVPLVQVEIASDAPADAIVAYAGRHDVDLVVMGTHGRRGFGRLLIGSVAEEVVRRAPCPVLTVRPRPALFMGPTVRRVLVPFDFSDHARTALGQAREIAAAYGARIDLLYVLDDHLAPYFGYDALPAPTVALQAHARDVLAAMEDEAEAAGVEAGVHVTVGHPALDVVDFAERNGVDLIVVSTHGRTGLPRLLLGSTAERIVRTAPCPVFTLKSFGRQLVAPAPPHGDEDVAHADADHADALSGVI